jgi:hypothetical protein
MTNTCEKQIFKEVSDIRGINIFSLVQLFVLPSPMLQWHVSPTPGCTSIEEDVEIHLPLRPLHYAPGISTNVEFEDSLALHLRTRTCL